MNIMKFQSLLSMRKFLDYCIKIRINNFVFYVFFLIVYIELIFFIMLYVMHITVVDTIERM